MSYLKNVWYQAGWPSEIDGGAILTRTILDLPILMFRDAQGAPRALLDRCPHRFAPLSAGRVEDGVVTCGYHGLAFDGGGRCVHNPHGRIGAIRVDDFPLVERHHILWIWPGDPERADPALIPDLSFIDATPETARIVGHMPTRAGYGLLVDNIMDLSHADYLHPTTLGGMFTEAKMTVVQNEDGLTVVYFAENCEPAPSIRVIVPPPSKADVRIEARWYPAGVMVLAASACPTGGTRIPEEDNLTLHSMTPETEGTTHYFYCSTRPFRTDDVELSASLKTMLEQAFVAEDKPMLEKQQARMGTADFWSLKPLLLPTDAAGVQVRRRLDRMIAAEREEAAPIPSSSAA